MTLASEVWDPTRDGVYETPRIVVWQHLPPEAWSALQQAKAEGKCQCALSGLAPLLFATDMWHSHRACPRRWEAWWSAIELVVKDAVGPGGGQKRVMFELVKEHEEMKAWVESNGWPLWRSALGYNSV